MAIKDDGILQEAIGKLRKLNRRGVVPDEIVNQAPGQFAPLITRQESALREVVGGEGDDNISTRKGTTRSESVV